MNKGERNTLRKLMHKLPNDAVMVELGTFKGNSAHIMVQEMVRLKKNYHLHCFDTYKDEYSFGEELARKKLKRFKCSILKIDTTKAADTFDEIDFVFIDGDHSYEKCKADIIAWKPKMKKGAIMAGHDYGRKCFGVTEAVAECFEKAYNPERSIWWTYVL